MNLNRPIQTHFILKHGKRGESSMKRRDFLKLSVFIGTVAATGIGIEKLTHADTPPAFSSVKSCGKEVEARVDLDSGTVELNPNIIMRHSACLGCYSSCGNRIKIEKNTGRILRVSGNPYNPNNTEPHLDLEAPLTDSYLAFSGYKDYGHKYRSTLCARGNATLQSHNDPFRILVPLKRADKRGEGKWEPITWEQAVNETVEGGTLFKHLGENKTVEGLRQIYDLKTPLDDRQPELGPKANQLVFIGGRGDGRTAFASRFTGAFGTPNFYTHGYT